MSQQENILSGAVINAPKGPFWPRRERELMSQICTAIANAKVVLTDSTNPTVKISGRNLIFSLPRSLVTTPTQTTPSAIDQFRVTAEWPDKLDCIGLTGENTGKAVSVFKPQELVNRAYDVTYWTWQVHYQPLQLVIGGVNTTSPNKRFSRWINADPSALGASYKEVIYPKYVAEQNPDGSQSGEDNIILAFKDSTGNYYDMNIRKPRKWMKEVVVCTTNGTELALIDSSHVYSNPITFGTI